MIDIFLAGGPIMYPLLMCSALAMTVIVERMIFWAQLNRDRRPEQVKALLSSMPDVNSKSTSMQVEHPSLDIIVRILMAGFDSTDKHASMRLRLAAEYEASKLDHKLGILSTLVTLTPLMGIFGTVLGIIESFQFLGDAALADPVAASGGLAKALITTAMGLGIAMPCLIALRIFRAKSAKLQREIENSCTEFEINSGLIATP